MVYGIFTAGQRTWGGPRADAGAADATTTPQQAIEKAAATGDDLNVVPESFKPALEAQNSQLVKAVPLLPPDRLDGRFAAPERQPGGWYQQVNDSLVSMQLGGLASRRPPLHPRDSFDSTFSVGTSTNSVYMPKRGTFFSGVSDAIC
jgi:chitin synthase